jgi:hypothetical protein
MANTLTPVGALGSSYKIATYCGREVAGLVDLAHSIRNSNNVVKSLQDDEQAERELMKGLSEIAPSTSGRQTIMRRYADESKVMNALIPSTAKHGVCKVAVALKLKSSEKQRQESERRKEQQKMNLALHVTGIEILPLVQDIATNVSLLQKQMESVSMINSSFSDCIF